MLKNSKGGIVHQMTIFFFAPLARSVSSPCSSVNEMEIEIGQNCLGRICLFVGKRGQPGSRQMDSGHGHR